MPFTCTDDAIHFQAKDENKVVRFPEIAQIETCKEGRFCVYDFQTEGTDSKFLEDIRSGAKIESITEKRWTINNNVFLKIFWADGNSTFCLRNWFGSLSCQ